MRRENRLSDFCARLWLQQAGERRGDVCREDREVFVCGLGASPLFHRTAAGLAMAYLILTRFVRVLRPDELIRADADSDSSPLPTVPKNVFYYVLSLPVFK